MPLNKNIKTRFQEIEIIGMEVLLVTTETAAVLQNKSAQKKSVGHEKCFTRDISKNSNAWR